MTPDTMNQQYGEHTAAEIARHVADLRTTRSSRSWRVAPMARRAMSGLMSRLRAHAGTGTVEPAAPHAIPMSH